MWVNVKFVRVNCKSFKMFPNFLFFLRQLRKTVIINKWTYSFDELGEWHPDLLHNTDKFSWAHFPRLRFFKMLFASHVQSAL
jgi:hypothetical protein